MIHEGERNIKGKLKIITELKEWEIKNSIEQAKRCVILFVCQECGLQISFEPKSEVCNSDRISFEYDDYNVWFKNEPDYIPIRNNYKNTNRGYWGGPTSYICLDCAKGLFDKEITDNTCEKCGSKNLVRGNELSGKSCPICGTKLNDGIKLQGLETYWAKREEIKNEWWNIYRERYHVKKPIPPNYTKEEIAEQQRRKALIKCYNDEQYVIESLHNVIRFEFRDAFISGSFSCILEWDDGAEGKLTLFKMLSDIWIEKIVEHEKVEQIIDLLRNYDYFNKKFFKDDKGIKLDGYTFGLEVKYGKKYKELAIWGIRRGILYDVGMLLIKFADKTFKELYEYAW
jgi:DNA-directed RNA polymerase subunit RPC12/RpoP